MKIRLHSLMAGPDGVAHPGQIINVSGKVGRDLIAGGFAELVDKAVERGSKREQVTAPPPETAVTTEATPPKPSSESKPEDPADDEESSDRDSDEPLGTLSLADLRVLASDLDIPGRSSMNREELIAALEARSEAEEDA